MTVENDFKDKGYSKGEVEILIKLNTLDERQQTIINNYVTEEEFRPVQRIVYGLVSLVLVAVFTGLVALVVAK